MNEYKFSDSPLQNYLHKKWITGDFAVDPSEVYTKSHNLTNYLYNDIKFRMLNKKNYLISLYGYTGIGKSTVAQQIAKYTHDFIMSKYCKKLTEQVQSVYGRKPEFDASNICFDTDELLKRLKDAVPMETFIYDEAGSEKITGSGSMRQKWDQQRIMKRVRVLQHNFLLCDPLADDTKMGQLHLYKLQPVQIDYKQQMNRSLIRAASDYGQYEIVGHIITPKYLVQGYEEKKDKQAREIEAIEFGGGRAKLYEQIANKILADGVRNGIQITKFKKQEWTALIEVHTHFQYSKDEIKIIGQFIRSKVAEAK